ncbi:hypothetical protein [Anabaena azotica]|uniref:Uncharacterized protein n=1 Tax=Anabaena azotica FACHB-119 TaxID=947527 RepID=A0ABR8D1R7_9NOST|nr:hypothetical protein [Anabaena azotica]MBD2500368.1 hypothetical protein [Anabaena azotica FACHB-119]
MQIDKSAFIQYLLLIITIVENSSGAIANSEENAIAKQVLVIFINLSVFLPIININNANNV